MIVSLKESVHLPSDCSLLSVLTAGSLYFRSNGKIFLLSFSHPHSWPIQKRPLPTTLIITHYSSKCNVLLGNIYSKSDKHHEVGLTLVPPLEALSHLVLWLNIS